MRIPYWVWKIKPSGDWSGWRVKYFEFTVRARIWDCEDPSCCTCPSRYHKNLGDTPVYRWKETA